MQKNIKKIIKCEGYTWELTPVSKEELTKKGISLNTCLNRQVRYLGKCLETNQVYGLSYFYKSDIGWMMTYLCY